MKLSEEIKSIRQKALYSQESFSSELGVSVSTINRWETGKVKPNITAMKHIREFCIKNNISYDEIEKLWFDPSLENN